MTILNKDKLINVEPKKKSILVGKMFLLGIATQVAASVLLTFVLGFMPDVADSYNQNVSNLLTMTPMMLLYVCVLAPISEELIFRGAVYGILRRVAPFIVANIFQALVFGIYHGNLVQGIYAFLLGMFIGWVMHLSGSLVCVMILHMSINLSGIVVSEIIPEETPMIFQVGAGIIAALVAVTIVRSLMTNLSES